MEVVQEFEEAPTVEGHGLAVGRYLTAQPPAQLRPVAVLLRFVAGRYAE